MSINEPILTISVGAKLLGLHPRTLMLYEKEGLTAPHRTNTKRRLYSVDDLDHLQFITFLTRETGINIRGVKTILSAIELAEKEGFNLKKALFPLFKLKKLI